MTTSSPATNEAVASTNSSDVRSTNPASSSAGPVEATTSVDKVTSVATLLADTEAATTLDTASGLDTVTSLELNTNPAPSSSSAATVAGAGAETETVTAGAETEPETTAQSLLVSASPAPAPAPSSSSASASAKHSNASSKSAVKGDLSKNQTDSVLLNSDLLVASSDPISDDVSDTKVTKSGVLPADEIFTTQQNYSESSVVVFLGENQTETISEIEPSETMAMPLDGVDEFEELEAKSEKGEEAHELAESRSLKMEEVPDCVLPTSTHPNLHPPQPTVQCQCYNPQRRTIRLFSVVLCYLV